MKKVFFYAVLFTLAACSSNQGNDEKKDSSNTDSVVNSNNTGANLDTVDIMFLTEAAHGGQLELEASDKILSYTNDASIKKFAEMMKKDHTALNGELKTLAAKTGYTVPQNIPEKNVEAIKMMEQLKDEGRDEYYIKLMVEGHTKAVQLFTDASHSKNAAIQQFASAKLPILKNHTAEVMHLDSLLQLPKTNQGDDPLKISNRKN